MLLDFAKNQVDETRIKLEWKNWQYKNGHKDINVNNFLKLDQTYCRYVVDSMDYAGFFTKKEIDFIFEVIDYFEGEIIILNG